MKNIYNRFVAACTIVALWPGPAFAQAVSPIDYGPNSLAGARLGIAIATLGELADAPELLARPSSQSFIDDTFTRISTIDDPSLRSHAVRRRDAMRPADGAVFDRNAAYAAVADLAKDTLRASGADRAQFVALGIFAEQTAYNARVLHDSAIDGDDRTALGNNAAADPLVPGLRELRAKLVTHGAHAWPDTSDVAQQIVAALLGSDTATPFPPSPAVWLVVLRARATGADARRHAAHYFIDVIHYDGTHQTIGAYPDGGLAFDHDTAHLTCAFDREPGDKISRTVPVPPGLGSSSAQLADALVRSCNDARTEGLHYHVVSADDDRFVADILFRNGVSVGPVLRAAVTR